MWICRGAPGLGRVTPSVALERTCPLSPRPQSTFLSYLAGALHLGALGYECIDLGAPAGHALDPLGAAGEIVVRELRRVSPALVVVDGEPQMVPLVVSLGFPVAVLANPHDVFGELNHFRLTTRALAALADVVLVGALEPRRFRGEVNGAMPHVHVTSPAVKPMLSRDRAPGERPRVLVTLGGGSVHAGDGFLQATSRVSAGILQALQALGADALPTVAYAPGHDGPTSLPGAENVEILARHDDVVGRVASADVVITRGGRNTIAEALSAGAGLLVVPISSDPLRGAEQLRNAEAAERLGNAIVLDADELRPAGVADAVAELLARRQAGPPTPYRPGNDAIWEILLPAAGLASEPDE